MKTTIKRNRKMLYVFRKKKYNNRFYKNKRIFKNNLKNNFKKIVKNILN